MRKARIPVLVAAVIAGALLLVGALGSAHTVALDTPYPAGHAPGSVHAVAL
jgi:hypothetical protein